MQAEQHDVVVVGGGVAGVSAALECVDVGLDIVLLEAGTALGGQLAEIPHGVRNVATGIYRDGRMVQAAVRRSAELLGDRVRLAHEVTAADLTAGWVDAAG